MMITIHGLPPKTTFQAVKTLVKQECNIIDFILDNLVDDGPDAKKVRIGVSDDSEGYRIMKYLNGFRMSPTHLLKIVPVGKALNPPPDQSYNQRSSYPNEPQNDYQNQSQSDYQNMDSYGNRLPPKDTRKGNYVPPHMRKKNIEKKQELLNSGPLRQPEIRPPNLGHSVVPHGSHMAEPQSHGSSSLVSGPHGISSHISSSGPHNSGLHTSHGTNISAPDMRSSQQWGQDVNAGRDDWSSRQGMQGSSGYNQRPAQTGYGQQQPQPAEQYPAPQGRAPALSGPGYGFQPKPVQEHLAPPVNRDSRQHVLRAVDIVDTPPAHYHQDKPITIKKDNFQGPQYNALGAYPPQNQANVWQMDQQPKSQYDDRHPIDKREPEKRGQFIPIGTRPVSPLSRSYQEPRSFQERRVSPSRLGPPVREFSPSRKRFSPGKYSPGKRSPGRYSPGRRFSPGRKVPPSDRRPSPGRKLSPGRKRSPGRYSPGRKRSPGRKSSPGRYGDRKSSPGRYSPGRKSSPGRYSPGRKSSPGRYSPGRKSSPGRYSPGRKLPPRGPGRQASPDTPLEGLTLAAEELKRKSRELFNRATTTNRPEDWEHFKHAQEMYKKEVDKLKRRIQAVGEGGLKDKPQGDMRRAHESPPRYSGRQSPTRRLVSPTRPRFSPSRLGNKIPDKFLDESASKSVRPAYESTQAQNQYTGGFRDSQYPRQDVRPSPWQNEKIVFNAAAKEEDRRDMTRRLDNPVEETSRLSRSPLKDRFRRSLSPRSRSSRSPRRSWALEKRSPETVREPPPPPSWPGKEPQPTRKPTRFSSPPQQPKHVNVWERLDQPRREEKVLAEKPRPFQGKLRIRSDLQDKMPARIEFGERRDFRTGDRKQSDRDREFRDLPEFRRESPRRETRDTKKPFTDIDKDFEDVYEREVEIRKKTEEGQRSGDRNRADDRYRPDSPRRSRSRERKDWQTKDRKRLYLSPSVKTKRDKASDEIIERILNEYELSADQKSRIVEEMKVTLASLFIEMFGGQDVSFIELVIKYQSKYSGKEEEKLLQDVLSNLPSHYRTLKRKSDRDIADIAAKVARRSPPRPGREETNPRPKLSDATIPEWQSDVPPPQVMQMSLSVAPAVNMAAPGMVPAPMYTTSLDMPPVFNTQLAMAQLQQNLTADLYSGNLMQQQFSGQQIQQQFSDNQIQQFVANQQMLIDSSQQFTAQPQQFTAQPQQFTAQPQQYTAQPQHGVAEPYDPVDSVLSNDSYVLYLCQDDFEPFSTAQSESLKNFIFKQIFNQSDSSDGWTPDLLLKGLQSAHRYEISTTDAKSRDWVVNLDFSDFPFFNVLVYTKEELWYERAAIWLPGHSGNRSMEPLDKLKRQNRYLEDINIAKWKFVKKVVTLKGTRLYVDMPPSSARALESHKMMLSYELQKVNVFLKAVAVDKNVFDDGLKQLSITDGTLLAGVKDSPMPTLNVKNEPGIVKIGLGGHKTLTIEQARKVKQSVVYHLMKYLHQEGTMKTDFVKYGFCPPNAIGIVPENPESKRWLLTRSFGKRKRAEIVVYGDETDSKTYFKMFVELPNDDNKSATPTSVLERIKHSNQGMRGIHFNFWKPIKVSAGRKKYTLEVDIDLESMETLSTMHYKLDYISIVGVRTVVFRSQYSHTKLKEKIKKCKAEQADSYVIANMDLDSDTDDD